jgi:NADPH-dependent 2,4-dienoyl-CoA reductase/sulfur reductase-like enzyme
MTNYLIIGTGAAGISAAETIRAYDPGGRLTLVGEEPDGYYSRPGLAYLLTGELPESQLYPFSTEELRTLRCKFVREQAVAVDPASRRVRLATSHELAYDRLLLATGAAARKPNLPGVDLPGVVQLDNFSDAREIIQRARKGKAAVVIGGGITALEIVEGLVAQDIKVHYFLRGDRYWGNVLDESESRIVEHRLQEEGVEIHYHTEAKSIYGRPTGLFGRGPLSVGGVRTQHDEDISCQIVALAIGVVPRLELAKSAGLDLDRGVLVDEHMRTSDPYIYAAGDIAQAYDPASGKALLDVLWPVARDQGRVAGANMAGIPTTYEKDVPLNVTRLAGLTTTIIGRVGVRGQDEDTQGIVRGDSETWREIPDALTSQQGFNVNRIRLMIGGNRIVGAIVMGDQTLSRPIHQLVARQVDISPIRDKLVEGKNLGDVIAEFWGGLRG